MPKRSNRKLRSPFELSPEALREWHALQDEVGGTFRGLGLSEAKLWKLCILAEHAADWRRRRIEPKYLETLKVYREQFGLPSLPLPEQKAA